MLVSRGMKDHLRIMLLENASQPFCIAYICDHRREQQVWIILTEFEKNFEDAVFSMTQQNKLRGITARNLPAQLTSDGASGTSDKHTFSFKRRTDCLIVDMYMLAAQKVGDIHFAQTVDAHPAADQFINTRHCAGCDSPGTADIVNLSH